MTDESLPKKGIRGGNMQYNCGGYISFSKQNHRYVYKNKHTQHHAEKDKPLKISDEFKQNFSELCDSGLRPFQILGQLRTESFTALIYHDIYSLCLKITAAFDQVAYNSARKSAISNRGFYFVSKNIGY